MESEFVLIKVAKCQSKDQTDVTESLAADAIKVCASNVNLIKWLPTMITTNATNIWTMLMEATGDLAKL